MITISCIGRIERAFKGLGGNLKEFLATLDGVHDVLKHQQQIADEEDQESGFICTSCEDHLQLDFTTERPAVAYLLVGSLKALSQILYSTIISVEIKRNGDDSRCFRYVNFGIKISIFNCFDKDYQ